MTIEEVLRRVDEVRESAGDFEQAHNLEDKLHHDVLEAISKGAEYPIGLATAALLTRDIPFARYCA